MKKAPLGKGLKHRLEPHICRFQVNWLAVEPTHLKNMSQIGNLLQIGVKIKNTWNHHQVKFRGVYVVMGNNCCLSRLQSHFLTIGTLSGDF